MPPAGRRTSTDRAVTTTLLPEEYSRAGEGESRREPQTEVTGAGQGTGTEEERLSRHR